MKQLNSAAWHHEQLHALEKRNVYDGLINHEISRWKKSEADGDALHALFLERQVIGRAAMSNTRVRWAAIEALAATLMRDWKRDRSTPRFWVTFCLDVGATWFCDPVVDLPFLEQKIRKALADVGLTGIVAFQFDSFRPITGEPDRRMWSHAHAFCQADNDEFSPKACEDKLNGRRSFTNALRALPVKIVRATLSKRDFARLAAYMLAHPHEAKNPVPSRVEPGRIKLRGTQKGFEASTCLRLGELWSHITAFDAVCGVGTYGTALAAAYRSTFRRRFAALASCDYPAEIPDIAATAQLWIDLRQRNGSKRLIPASVRTQSNHRIVGPD